MGELQRYIAVLRQLYISCLPLECRERAQHGQPYDECIHEVGRSRLGTLADTNSLRRTVRLSAPRISALKPVQDTACRGVDHLQRIFTIRHSVCRQFHISEAIRGRLQTLQALSGCVSPDALMKVVLKHNSSISSGPRTQLVLVQGV